MHKLSVDHAELKNGAFLCDCYLGDDETMQRTVLFDELVRFMNGKDGVIPVNDDDPDSNEYEMPLLEWIEREGLAALWWELSRCINQREARTDFAPSRLNTTELTALDPLQSIPNQSKAA